MSIFLCREFIYIYIYMAFDQSKLEINYIVCDGSNWRIVWNQRICFFFFYTNTILYIYFQINILYNFKLCRRINKSLFILNGSKRRFTNVCNVQYIIYTSVWYKNKKHIYIKNRNCMMYNIMNFYVLCIISKTMLYTYTYVLYTFYIE